MFPISRAASTHSHCAPMQRSIASHREPPHRRLSHCHRAPPPSFSAVHCAPPRLAAASSAVSPHRQLQRASSQQLLFLSFLRPTPSRRHRRKSARSTGAHTTTIWPCPLTRGFLERAPPQHRHPARCVGIDSPRSRFPMMIDGFYSQICAVLERQRAKKFSSTLVSSRKGALKGWDR